MYSIESETKAIGQIKPVKVIVNPKTKANSVFITGKLIPLGIHISIWLVYKLFMYYFNVVRAGVPGYVFWAFTGFGTILEPLIFYSYYLSFMLFPSEDITTTTPPPPSPIFWEKEGEGYL